NLIVKLNQVFRITMVVVTHDLPSAWTIADRVMMMLDGRVVALGDKEQVWNDPDPRIRAFLERRMTESADRASDFMRVMAL
ncbi:MAG TPA: ABC transporter ATP-binding protein, partial [Planctomycetota bacterium]|nr:ABC transporter ATP-binding protein [Planctomycetota bacterium]